MDLHRWCQSATDLHCWCQSVTDLVTGWKSAKSAESKGRLISPETQLSSDALTLLYSCPVNDQALRKQHFGYFDNKIYFQFSSHDIFTGSNYS